MTSEKKFVLAVGGAPEVRGRKGFYTTRKGACRARKRLQERLRREGKAHLVETYYVVPVVQGTD
jgi:hypothetical protein